METETITIGKERRASLAIGILRLKQKGNPDMICSDDGKCSYFNSLRFSESDSPRGEKLKYRCSVCCGQPSVCESYENPEDPTETVKREIKYLDAADNSGLFGSRPARWTRELQLARIQRGVFRSHSDYAYQFRGDE